MKPLAAALAFALAASPLAADEVEDVIQQALDSYRGGDVAAAQEDLTFALQRLGEMKAGDLAAFLPEPQEGWTREDAEVEAAAGPMMVMMGGGTMASADYTNEAGDDFTLTLMADSPMVASMGAMLTMGGGRTVRIQRESFMVGESDVQGVVDGVLVQAEGDAPVDAMTAHIEAMDLSALGDF